MRLIGINGFKGSGKDTTYECIKNWARINEEPDYPIVVTRVAFADKMKIMAGKALGFIELNDDECIKIMNKCKAAWDITVLAPRSPEREGRACIASFNGRQYLQWFGGEARNVFGDTFWIDQVLPNVQVADGVSIRSREISGEYSLMKRYQGTDILCVTDVRYPNEAQRILDLGGEIWEIIKPGLKSDGHGSEVILPHNLVTKSLINDGSVDDLRSLVAAAL